MNRILSVELKAITRAVLFSLALGLVSAIVIYFSSLSEELLPALGKSILILSVFLAACQVSKHYGSKGLIRGLSMGMVFFIIMLIATLLFNPSLIVFKTFVYTLLLCLLAGGLGGILGIGLNGN
ncbi:MAG: TIGR04086 family membrane protein [Syntrophomonas sp.]|uniref:TIGR04086 family membrane protein n=1 Tax=Syntrophomonas sp. TaxID=2053627 RepID=UPI0026199B7F|nr:TIGR04086 family membrane protein [Syntrophomonas sp.]MDD2509757.1 TIGR04086 family membrane protein [Syntrophomonas sp.]MDD3879505.1 TIGR04086 family membrane protein [Syntrophomonas sp.]MDD4625750.1 TIGR04086 family membrane protein [Syntrophomonas sp.]